MSERFYFPAPLQEGLHELDGPEAHHMTNVLRLKEGDKVELFDGEGVYANAVIESKKKKSVTLRIDSPKKDQPVQSGSFSIASALPKGDRFRWMMEDMEGLKAWLEENHPSPTKEEANSE